ncbi:uncharacterized protein [Amphiura filiformis]|uniref:uncharacterized protein n=1 Tax=Amphiura filiformis TaxID=82378 RepID=UPI003B22136D
MAGHSHIKMWIISTLLLMSFVHPSLANVKKEAKYLILGAGAGGLHAARLLLAQNITDFIILEGTNQIGGRSERSVDFGGITFNPGDMFVYGNIDYLQRLGFGLQKYDFAFWEVRNDQGEDITPEANTQDGILYAAKEATNDLAEGVVKHERPDIDQKTAMAMKGWLAKSPLDEIVQWYYFDFDQGIQMKRESLVGTYRQSLQPDYYLITDYGDSGLFSDVEQQLDEDHLHLGEVVVKIDQSGDKVTVTTGNTPSEEEEYVADYVLVTFSLGVLQQGELTFIPPLPEWKTEQLCRYQRGTIEGVLLRFASKFWSDAEWILHASDRQDVDYHHYPAFLNVDREWMHPGSNILVAILTGKKP